MRARLIVGAALAALALASTARADVIVFANYDPAHPEGGGGFLDVVGTSGGPSQSIGLIFTAATSGNLNSVEVAFQAIGAGLPPSGAPYDTGFVLSLYAAGFGGPGALLETFAPLSLGAASGPVDVTASSALHPFLASGSSYYLVARPEDANSAVGWSTLTGSTSVYRESNGQPSIVQTSPPTAILTGSAAVPEPAALPLLAIGLAAWAMRRRPAQTA